MRRQTITVPETTGGRVDRFVADASGLSRSYVQKLISEGQVTVAGLPIKSNEQVVPGEIIELEVPDPIALELEPESIPLSIVYEDDDMLIIDKPSGLVVHPAPGHSSGTLVNALLARDTKYGGIAGVMRPGIVHRLDRDTSGLLMVAKNDIAQASLMAQLKARAVKKTYLALALGSVAANVGRNRSQGQGQVRLLHGPSLELGHQTGLGNVVLGDHQKAAGVAVQSMNDAGAHDAGDAAVLGVAGKQSVNESAA